MNVNCFPVCSRKGFYHIYNGFQAFIIKQCSFVGVGFDTALRTNVSNFF